MGGGNASMECLQRVFLQKGETKRHSILVQLKVSFLMIHAYYAKLTLFNKKPIHLSQFF